MLLVSSLPAKFMYLVTSVIGGEGGLEVGGATKLVEVEVKVFQELL